MVLAVRLRLAGHHEWALLTTWIGRSPARVALAPPTAAELGEMPFDTAWHHLVTHLRQMPIDAIILSVEDADGGLAELSWSSVDVLLAASAIEVMHRSRQAHCCRLRIESSQPIAAGDSSRLITIVDRFAEFWAAHPETVPTTPPAVSVTSSPALRPALANHRHPSRETSGVARSKSHGRLSCAVP